MGPQPISPLQPTTAHYSPLQPSTAQYSTLQPSFRDSRIHVCSMFMSSVVFICDARKSEILCRKIIIKKKVETNFFIFIHIIMECQRAAGVLPGATQKRG